MVGQQRRQPPGRPIGGQYATAERAEPTVALGAAKAPDGWPANLPAPDVRLDLDDPDSPATRVYTGNATLRVASDGRMVSYDFTASEADLDTIQAAIDWARAEHAKATRPAGRVAALGAREADLVDQRAVAVARTLSWWATDLYGPDGQFEIGVDPDDPEAMTIVRGWCDEDHQVAPDDLAADRDTRINGWMTGRDLARLLPMNDSAWFELTDHVHPGGDFEETTYRIGVGYHSDMSKIHYLNDQIHKVQEARAIASLDYIAEDAAHAFGDGTQLHFGPTEMGHMVVVAVVRPDGTRVGDAEFEQWFGAAPNEDDPYLPDLCRKLPMQESAWFDRAEAVEVDQWETVYAVRAGGAR